MRRREFLKTVAGAAAFFATARRAYSYAQSPLGISKFTATLPGLGPAGANNFGNYIPVLTPNQRRFPGIDYYEIVARQFTQHLHPALAKPTTFWGYADARTRDSKYLGGVIVAKRGTPVRVKIKNQLPPVHPLPVDPTTIDPSMGAEVGGRVDRIAVHLHGGLVTWTSDGGPFAWFSNPDNPGGFVHGSSFLNGDTPGTAVYDYPNDQSARLIWYHDHAYSITRLNAYAGLATAYLITDDAEAQLISSGVLPDVPGYPLGIPLVIQDKTFFDGSDPNYPGLTRVGSLWYPYKYECPPQEDTPSMLLPPQCGTGTGRWDCGPVGEAPPVSCVPEFFADTMLVNGAPYPTLPVAPRRYRFRVLNGSQARFLNLQLYVADGSLDGITLKARSEVDPNGNPIMAPTNPAGPKMIQIGTEGGFLPAPVVLNSPPTPLGFYLPKRADPTNGNANRYNLLLAPAERADLVIDFRGFEGQTVILYSDAPAPFPGGDIRNDYYPGGFDLSCIGGAPAARPGYGPDTRVIMRFVVGTSGSVSELSFRDTLSALAKALPVTYAATQPPAPASTGLSPKTKTLNEDFDTYGRLRQRLGAPDAQDYLTLPTEIVNRGEVQTWQIFNLTGDTHPMHFHLVNVQILKRETWQFTVVDGEPAPVFPLAAIRGTARPPDPNERGWKETVRMNPGEVITVLMKFDMPSGAPPSPRLQSMYGITGAEYVWHCHILEHEEHDMMHALVVV